MHSDYPARALTHPLRTLGLAGVIAFVSLILTVVIPGLVAWHNDVFYEKGLKAKFAEKELKKKFVVKDRNLLDDFETRQESRLKEMRMIKEVIEKQFRDPNNKENLAAILERHAQIQKEYDAASYPIHFVPFFQNIQILLHPVLYTCLGCLVFLVRPPNCSVSFFRTAAIALGIYLASKWPQYIRTFLFDTAEAGRMVVAYPNWDIDLASFIMQEMVGLGACILLAVIWKQW